MDSPIKVMGRILCAALGAALLYAGPARADSSNVYGLFKSHEYLQTSSAAPVALSTFPYSFSVQGSGTGSLSVPGGLTVTLPQSNPSNNGDLLVVGFASESSLLGLYPNGTYKLSLSGLPTLSYTVTSGYAASVPQVTNGTWQNNVLVVDPSSAATLNFSTFSEYSQGVAGHMSIQIQSADGTNSVNVRQQYATINTGSGTTVSATPFTSYQIPAGTLTAGSVYQCQLNFDSVGSADTTSVPNAISVSLYTDALVFYIVGKSSSPPAAPTLSANLANQTGPLGGSATFTPNVTWGSGAQQPNSVSWLWLVNGLPINFDGVKYVLGPGGTLTVNNITTFDVATYQLIVTTGGGLAESSAATLAIGAGTPGTAPTITTQPSSQTIANGGTVSFHIDATGASSYQWLFNGNPLSNGNGVSNVTGGTLVIEGASASSAGSYACSASNSNGTTTSNAATLSVSSTSDLGRLVNISCRAAVGTGGNILIAGFVVGGQGTSGTLPVLIRGTGPALAGFGVAGALSDPQLQLYRSNPDGSSTLLQTNTGWSGNSSITAEDSAVGAFALTNSSSKDSALYVPNLQPNSYTSQIAGASGDTGVSLAEIYDATPAGTYTPASPRIINISARVQVGTGGNILIAGFVIGGSTSKTVLVRASGPALVPFGVPGTLPDPQLNLYRSNPDGSSTLLRSNTGWGGKTEISSTASSVGAFAWSNPSSRDSALLATLPPGSYTAQVSGSSNDTGVALVELYEVP